jgi:guanine deaminase
VFFFLLSFCFVYSGKGLDVGLLEWLEKYTFPTEAKFKDLEFAEHVYEKAVV